MKKTSFIIKSLALLACLLCSMSASAAEAYACLTQSNMRLTFYYDNLRRSRTGQTFDLNTGSDEPEWQWDDLAMEITQVVFDPSFAGARPTSTYYWFAFMYELQSITGLNYLNTSEVTNMGYMFSSCGYVDSLDLSHFNTEKVTNMFAMFNNSSRFTSLDLSSFNTARVTDMDCMFYYCDNLRTIRVGDGWSTDAVTKSEYMFWYCTSLVGGKGTTYDVNHVDKTYAHVDGGSSNPGYLTVMTKAYALFSDETKTMKFYCDDQWSNRNGVIYDLNTGYDYPAWFCTSSAYTCKYVVFDPSFANARPTTTFCWFFGMNMLESITGVQYLNTSEVTIMNSMFSGCHSLTSLYLNQFNTSQVRDMNAMFSSCRSLTSLYLNQFNTSQVTSMSLMFCDCSSLTSLNLSNFNTSQVTSMDYMFLDCGQITSLNLSSFNTSQVTGMESMFENCHSLATLNLSNFNTSQVTTMECMFRNCWSLASLDLGSFNTANVIDMRFMFNGCSGLTSLNVSGFNTANVIGMRSMFHGCSSLTSLDVSSFNTSKVTDMREMFNRCTNLTTIYAGSGWSTAIVTNSSDMFYDCTSLVGGMGTTYDANHVDKAYAHIDGGTSNPGYFTGWKKGDVNHDGNIDVSDVTLLISYVLNNVTLDATDMAVADMNNDGMIDVADVTALIAFVLSH